MAKWKKPNGNKIETNDLDATVEHCASLGWERLDKPSKGDKEVKPSPKKVKAKPGKPNPFANPDPMDNDK